jgi:hypothetical protein
MFTTTLWSVMSSGSGQTVISSHSYCCYSKSGTFGHTLPSFHILIQHSQYALQVTRVGWLRNVRDHNYRTAYGEGVHIKSCLERYASAQASCQTHQPSLASYRESPKVISAHPLSDSAGPTKTNRSNQRPGFVAVPGGSTGCVGTNAHLCGALTQLRPGSEHEKLFDTISLFCFSQCLLRSRKKAMKIKDNQSMTQIANHDAWSCRIRRRPKIGLFTCNLATSS